MSLRLVAFVLSLLFISLALVAAWVLYVTRSRESAQLLAGCMFLSSLAAAGFGGLACEPRLGQDPRRIGD